MKKKLLALVLILAVVLSLGAPAFASTAVGGFSLSRPSLSLRVGYSEMITTNTTDPLTWTSTNPAVAVVSDGYVTGVGLGVATIVATSANTGTSATCVVHIGKPGVDVSAHQGAINWASAASSGLVDFAIIRTGYGSENWYVGGDPKGQIDQYFEANYAGATSYGIKVGAYHYSYATTVAAAQKEADMCLYILNGRRMDYPVFYDIEEAAQKKLSPEALADIVDAFCSKIQAAGYQTGVYSSPSFFNGALSSPRIDKYDRWLAHWGVDVTTYTKPYKMWQYGYTSVPGIGSNIDGNYSYYDYYSTGNESSGGVVAPPDNNETVPPPPPENTGFTSDTNGTYTFGAHNSYCYKITTTNTTAPTVSSYNAAVATVAMDKKLSDGYLYRITNEGPGQTTITTTDTAGNSHNLTVNGKTKSGIVSDTPMTINLKVGKTYTFKFTPAGGATGVISCGVGANLIKGVAVKKDGSSYLYTVQGVKPGTVGVYAGLAGAAMQRQCIVTVV